MVLAMIALFFALGGAAGAVTAVPLAKRALNADNAKKLSGKTLTQVVSQAAALPSPTIAITRTGVVTIPGDAAGYAQISCSPGEKALAGGYSTSGLVIPLDTFPVDDLNWRIYLINGQSTSNNVALYVSCVLSASANGGSFAVSPGAGGGKANVQFQPVVGSSGGKGGALDLEGIFGSTTK
jgi:hypothetical protein